MKKKLIIIIGIFVAITIAVLSFYQIKLKNTDAYKFKESYEALNDTEAYGFKYQNLNIPKDNKIKYATLDEAIDIIENGTGLIYFGFPNCPWCRGMLPILLDTVECSCLENVLYVDASEIRDVYELKDGEVKISKEASKEYYKLLELLDANLSEYTLTEGEKTYEVGEKRIYVPFVVGVKNGKIVGSFETITLDEGQTAFDKLTENQKNEYRKNYQNIIGEITKEETSCTDHC